MSKLKSKITILLALFLGSSFAVMLCSMFARRGNVETYKITYVAVEYGEVVDIDPDFFVKGGKYPTEYVSGKETYVDDLKDIIYPSAYEDNEFCGWYLDKECTQAFDGKIEKTSVGNITLYADIAVAFWTKYY